MAVIDAIVSNFLGYDLIIIVLAAINVVVLIMTKSSVKRFDQALHKRNDLSLRRKNEEVVDVVTVEDLRKIKETRTSANRWHTWFVNIITIFPLLGLLGTVMALMNVASGAGFESIEYSFMMSLTSTFWGMVFAIFFKFFDSSISPDMDLYNSDALRLLTTQEETKRV